MTPQDLRNEVARQCGFPSILQSMERERAKYYASKQGICQGCGAEIAREEQYCEECEQFLIQSMEEKCKS